MYRMTLDITTLPDDPELLKERIAELASELDSLSSTCNELASKNDSLSSARDMLASKYDSLETEYKSLEEKFKILQRKFFGRSSEKLTVFDETQGLLFNEIESGAVKEPENDESVQEEIFEKTVVKEHSRRKCGRKALPADLPREIVVHEMSEEERLCLYCSKERKEIGRETTEELVIIPEQIKVRQHVYIKYGPCSCDDFLASCNSEIIKAPAPKRMIPGSIASAELLAYVTVSKFVDALPFYRQSKIFERIGVDLSRATMCNWMIEAHEKMISFLELFKEVMRIGPFIRMDETTVQVLREEGRSPSSNSYMWVALGYPVRNRPLVLYEYHSSRSGDIPCLILEGFRGYLQTDGYDGYNRVVAQNGLTHVGCMAHVRRNFFDAAKANKKEGRAHKALVCIRKIYEIESQLREKNLSDDDFVRQRKSAVIPLLNEFHEWLIRARDEVIPKSSTGKAVSYALNEWQKIIRYTNEAFLTPDNNAAENAIRPFVVGRKNWLFSNTPRGANASAMMYSLVESAKANSLEPYAYLSFLFSELPLASTRENMMMLLPCFITSEMLGRKSSGMRGI